jgi:hypothetical protein
LTRGEKDDICWEEAPQRVRGAMFTSVGCREGRSKRGGRMLDKVQVTISAYTFENLCKIHNKWRKEKGSVMAEQDVNYVINKLIGMAYGED